MPPAVKLKQYAPWEATCPFEVRDLSAKMDVDVPKPVGEDSGNYW